MEQSKRRSRGRRWFRFSLRRLLLVMALCCFGVAWLANRYVLPMMAHDQVIALGGGFVPDEPRGVFPGTTNVCLSQSNITDSDLRIVSKLPVVSKLWLNDTPITDDSIEFIACLPDLQFVDLRGTRVSASAVQSLQLRLPTCQIMTDSTPPAEQSKYLKGYSCPLPNCHRIFLIPYGVKPICSACGSDCSTRIPAEQDRGVRS